MKLDINQQDFIAFEKEAPDSYRHLMLIVALRKNRELEVQLHQLGPQPSETVDENNLS